MIMYNNLKYDYLSGKCCLHFLNIPFIERELKARLDERLIVMYVGRYNGII